MPSKKSTKKQSGTGKTKSKGKAQRTKFDDLVAALPKAQPKTSVPPEIPGLGWVRFMDMNSGGGRKHGYEHIYIQAATESEARSIFYSIFGTSPDRVSCTCCGEDYSYGTPIATLREATAFERGCPHVKQKRNPKTNLWEPLPPGVPFYIEAGDPAPEGFDVESSYRKYITLEKHLKSKDVRVIPASEISPEDKTCRVPRSGYVWMDED